MSQMYGFPELDESFDEYDEYEEYDEYDEFMEARRPNRRRPTTPVRTAPRGSAYKPKPPAASGPVTQAQLKEALATVSRQVGTNSTAIKQLDGRVRGLTTETSRTTAMLRKEMLDRKKDQDALRKELQSTREMAAILPIIAGDNPLIGLLLASGGGGGMFGGGSSASGSDGSGNFLITALVLSEVMKP